MSDIEIEIEQKKKHLLDLENKIEFTENINSITEMSSLIPDLSSVEIKEKLDNITLKRKEMVRNNEAWSIYAYFTLNDSLTEGKAQQKRLAKFLLAAFDKEVDNIIAFSRKSSFQKTHEKIENWFEKINKLGNDHMLVIEREYLKLRLEELKLSYQYFIKKKFEKDEERYINESIREEKRVQKEIEDFVKKTEIEEEGYLKDIEKITKKLLESSEDEARKLKETIRQLQLKLEKANYDKERAISLAQLTRSGHVYIISNQRSFGEGVYKIGMTRRLDPMDRVKELGNASVPFFFDVHGIIHSDDAPSLERELHRKFDEKRVNKQNYRREFFKVSLKEIESAINEIHGKVALDDLTSIEEIEFSEDED